VTRKQYSKDDRKRALRLHRKGWGYNRIADEIGCFPSTVKKWVEAAGQQKHPGPKYPKRKRDAAISHYQNNDVSIVEVAKRFEIHPRTFTRWLREEKVKIREPRSKIDRKGILADISSGMKKKDIAKKYKCSESWVYRIQSEG
jgi:transposase-like protein